MGCFLGCFGSSKDCRRRNQRHKVLAQPRLQVNSSYTAPFSGVVVQNYPEKPSCPVEEKVRVKPEEPQQSPNARKKVTFDTNVKTYEHVLLDQVTDVSPQNEEESLLEKEKEDLAKSSQSESSCDHSSITSSSSSYPPNHRYQNCQQSDDEGDQLDYEESDLDDDDGDVNGELDDEFDEDLDDEILESRARILRPQIIGDEVNGSIEEDVQPIGSIRGARDRSGYVHAVLNPVENLSQWKAVKTKGTAAPLKKQKENFSQEQESLASFSLEPRKLKQEVAVNASLSSWLSSTEITPVKSSNTPRKSMSPGSSSMVSLDDRPILGALTLEEIKQFSASNSPRKSPSKCPDDTPIIGTVGTYWTHNSTTKNFNSATSFKGIPNTTSKYREDKRVNWHSTPFEARLERALNGGAAEAFVTHN